MMVCVCVCVCVCAGEVARKHIKDPVLLKFIDLECFLWSTVNADLSPMISAGMVSGECDMCEACVRCTHQKA